MRTSLQFKAFLFFKRFLHIIENKPGSDSYHGKNILEICFVVKCFIVLYFNKKNDENDFKAVVINNNLKPI